MAEVKYKLVSELEAGDVLVGDAGGHSAVNEAAPSSAMPGFHIVETEHGCLYIDPEIELAVLDEG